MGTDVLTVRDDSVRLSRTGFLKKYILSMLKLLKKFLSMIYQWPCDVIFSNLMSAFGGTADILSEPSESPFMTRSGHAVSGPKPPFNKQRLKGS